MSIESIRAEWGEAVVGGDLAEALWAETYGKKLLAVVEAAKHYLAPTPGSTGWEALTDEMDRRAELATALAALEESE